MRIKKSFTLRLGRFSRNSTPVNEVAPYTGEAENLPEWQCPSCGKAQLRVSRLWGTRCDACDRSMGSYKYRNYPIRYCTHCGILPHAQGALHAHTLSHQPPDRLASRG
jgi:ribosomal protein L37AE/L43A